MWAPQHTDTFYPNPQKTLKFYICCCVLESCAWKSRKYGLLITCVEKKIPKRQQKVLHVLLYLSLAREKLEIRFVDYVREK